ncbi:uncharacterized protein LOC127790406 isoform X1 [Diospyros lotus]|uniref:uncharacterized protein LOC127790406 isoform X1 n=1 Tax=Diospyros lotus TaxID=55363 RepID=UPI002258CBBF|nr:uncharacterized protein LOC127790406 isoform X1 [Diospyros lotus]
MAPKRRRGDERQPEKPHAEVVQKASKQKASPPLKSVMVTRSSTRRLNGSGSTLADPQPEFSKPKAISKKKNPNPRAAKEAPPAKGNASKDGSKAATNKTIVIEHCKQCKSFLRRAVQVKDGLENDLSGITVLLNPEKEWGTLRLDVREGFFGVFLGGLLFWTVEELFIVAFLKSKGALYKNESPLSLMHCGCLFYGNLLQLEHQWEIFYFSISLPSFQLCMLYACLVFTF